MCDDNDINNKNPFKYNMLISKLLIIPWTTLLLKNNVFSKNKNNVF